MSSFPPLRSAGRLLASGLAELRERPRHQVPALDALRSFAVLMVVFMHWSVRDYVASGGVPTSIQQSPVFYYGWAGVDLFFVLSGFLIGKQLWRELDRTGTVRFWRFILRRGLRIWPVYFAIMLYYQLSSAEVRPTWSDWTFLSNYVYGGFTRGWSLATEEHFYIGIPLLLLAFRKRVPLFRFAYVLLAIEACVLIARYVTIEHFVAQGIALDPSPYPLVANFHLHLEGLLAGLFIALLAVVRPRLLQPAEGARGFAGGAFAIFVALTLAGFALRALHDKLFPYLALALIFGGATYWALRDRSLLSAPLRWGLWYPISRLSYSIYLNHWFVWPTSSRYIVRAVQSVISAPSAVYLVSMLIGTALSFLIAAVMFLLVEHPFLVLRDRVLARDRTLAPPSEIQAIAAD